MSFIKIKENTINQLESLIENAISFVDENEVIESKVWLDDIEAINNVLTILKHYQKLAHNRSYISSEQTITRNTKRSDTSNKVCLLHQDHYVKRLIVSNQDGDIKVFIHEITQNKTDAMTFTQNHSLQALALSLKCEIVS